MSNYLANLVARSLSTEEVLRPRRMSLFEPQPGILVSKQSHDAPGEDIEDITRTVSDAKNDNFVGRQVLSQKGPRLQESTWQDAEGEAVQISSFQAKAESSGSKPAIRPPAGDSWNESAMLHTDDRPSNPVLQAPKYSWNGSSEERLILSDKGSLESVEKRSPDSPQNPSHMQPPSSKVKKTVSKFEAKVDSIAKPESYETALKANDLEGDKTTLSPGMIQAESRAEIQAESSSTRSRVKPIAAVKRDPQSFEDNVLSSSTSFVQPSAHMGESPPTKESSLIKESFPTKAIPNTEEKEAYLKKTTQPESRAKVQEESIPRRPNELPEPLAVKRDNQLFTENSVPSGSTSLVKPSTHRRDSSLTRATSNVVEKEVYLTEITRPAQPEGRARIQAESSSPKPHVKPEIAAVKRGPQSFEDNVLSSSTSFIPLHTPMVGSSLTKEISQQMHKLGLESRPKDIAASEPENASTLKVTIGRIDVRAIMQPMPPRLEKKPAVGGPALSLDDYLKQTGGEKR